LRVSPSDYTNTDIDSHKPVHILDVRYPDTA
jgi:hypothetical protein